jgi:hypothetical protein
VHLFERDDLHLVSRRRRPRYPTTINARRFARVIRIADLRLPVLNREDASSGALDTSTNLGRTQGVGEHHVVDV